MDEKSSKADVESQLRQTAETMSDRLSSIREEVSSTGVSLRQWIVENPVKSVGGMLATGLAVGVLFGGGTSRRRRKEHTKLIDTYLNALRQEVETAVDRGEEPGPALEKALRDRVPLVVYRSSETSSSEPSGWTKTFLQEAGEIVFSTGLNLLARDVVESLLATLDIDEVIDDGLTETE